MALHETFTDNPGLASLLGPARVGLPGTWFGSVSIWSGQIIGFSSAGNPVVDVTVSGIPGVTSVQAEVFGVRTYDSTGLASVSVTMIEWSLPGSATILARYTFDSSVVFPLSVSRFVGILQFVDILANGPTPQQLFDDYFQNADTLIGGDVADIMDGGANNDILDGGGGADTLYGGAGSDDFIYRAGDAVTGEAIYGGSEVDTLLAIGAVVNGDILQAGGVDVSAINVNSIEEIHLNGTEVVINVGQLAAGGFETFVGRTGFVDQLTIRGVANGSLSTLNLLNWETGVDTIAVIGTNGADNVQGSIGNDIFLGQEGADIFDGAGGDDRFLITDSEVTPSDQFSGGIGTDVLQIDSVAISSVQITPVTNLRNMTLNSVETLDVVKGSFAMDATDFIGSISGTLAAPVLSTTGLNRIIGNGNGSGPNIVLLEIHVGTQLGLDMRNIVFENWNDGFYIDKTIRIVAGAQTQLILCGNEETWVNGSASTTGIYIGGGNQADEIYGSFQKDFILAGNGDDYIVALNGDDVVDGGDGSDSIWAGDGIDNVGGGSGVDNLNGENGDDRLIGGADNDVLNGGAGNDSLYGGLGADQHIGGDDAGIDYARYDDTNHGNLTIRLDSPAINAGAAAVGDTYVGIEGLVGGAGNDTVAGNSSANYLFGSGGADLVFGKGGADYLNGGQGGDNLYGGLGADQHIGGDDAGIDYARYDDGNYGNLTIRLDNAALNVGAAAVGDTYTGIEGLVGSSAADTIIGNAGANYLFGSAGTDFIDGLGGNDYLNGGADADRFRFSSALGVGNIDTIAGFTHAVDDILLLKSIFSAVGVTLTADEFRIGSAQDANDHILYNNITGALYYDSNGNAAGGITQFATVAAGTLLDVGDFMMV